MIDPLYILIFNYLPMYPSLLSLSSPHEGVYLAA